MVKVGIIGAGFVGGTLGKMLAKQHTVTFGVREVAKYEELGRATNTTILGVQDAVRASDVIILAIPGAHSDEAIQKIVETLGPDVGGKVLIDATNPLTHYPQLEVRWDKSLSGGEALAAALPNTAVYKAFNTIGAHHMDHADGSHITGQQLTMMFAGGPDRRAEVEEVIAAVGFKPVYVGPIRYARNLEALAELWIHLAVPNVKGQTEHWGRDFHFQVMRK